MEQNKLAQILIVEDNAAHQLVTAMFMTELGCHAHVVDDGAAAIDEVQSNHYDIVLMDLNLPDIDGFDTARQIRALGGNYKNLPIIAVSANNFSANREKCLAAGIDDFVSKPVDRRALLAAINNFYPLDVPDNGYLPATTSSSADKNKADEVLRDLEKLFDEKTDN